MTRASQALADQKSVGRDTQRGVVVETAPAAALVVIQAKLLFEILVVALDAPTRLRNADEPLERRW